ncbi:glutaminase A [Mycolicibacterium iranicum]|nr:glutaminase A [Mycolicibacterium iranicum]
MRRATPSREVSVLRELGLPLFASPSWSVMQRSVLRMRLPLEGELRSIFDEVARMSTGEVANYIPALSAADPDWFGVSIVTVDGQRYDLGDVEQTFTIQSVSKPFAYAIALEDNGVEAVLQRVGVEPSGDPFNAIELDLATHRPHNPMVNAGAILTTSLLTADAIDTGFARFAGRQLSVDDEVWTSERDSGDRNRAIAYLMRSFGMLAADVQTSLDTYFRQCSLLTDTRDLATMGATLANGGINPVTGELAVTGSNVPRVLSVMSTCGMYDYAGEWLYSVGLPAKSGVAGAVVAVLPGQFGLAVFSPRLDAHGNSVRGIAFCQLLSEHFGLHLFSPSSSDRSVVRAAYGGDAVRSKRQRIAEHEVLLKQAGHTTRVLELQGQLRFGSCEVLSRAIAELHEAEVIILDFRRVTTVDGSVGRLMSATAMMVEAAGATLVLTGAPGDFVHQLGAKTFETLADALEWREDEILTRAGVDTDPPRTPLADVEAMRGVDPSFLPVIEAAGRFCGFGIGEFVFHEGEPADRIYCLVSGLVDIVLVRDGSLLRIRTFGPGTTFGDMAALYGGTRTAGVRSATDSLCFEIEVVALEELCRDRPDVLLAIHKNLARALTDRVRQLSDEVRALQ